MRISVTGSRAWPDLVFIRSVVRMIASLDPLNGMIVSGDGGNVDLTAIKQAKESELDYCVYTPKWRSYGPPAGPIRNAKIVKTAQAGILLHDSSAKGNGTPGTIALFQASGKPFKVISLRGFDPKVALADVEAFLRPLYEK